MKNIVLTRIDDRLLHGQVIVSWIPYLKINEILIVDDEYFNDEFMTELIKDAAPDNIKVHVLDTEKSAEFLNSEDVGGSRLLILSRYIQYIDKLIKLSVPVKNVNVGGLGSAEGRKKCVNSIHLSSFEMNLLKNMAKNNIEVFVQMLPNDKKIDIEQV